MALYGLLANIVLFVHFGYVSFTVGGEAAILVGGLLRWRWVRNLVFRILHAASVVFVAVEAVVGMSCPLTVWEYQLRVLAGQQVGAREPFIASLVHHIMFYSFPAWVFLTAYVAYALLVGATFLFVRPIVGRRAAPRGAAGEGP